jgi:hypothetical protein
VTLLFDLLVDPPLVAERIDNLSVPSAPEHVLHGHAYARSGSHRTLDNPISIVNQQGDAHTRSPKRLRRLAGSTFARGELIAYEELLPVQSQFAVHKLLAARFHHSVYFLSAKNTLVEIERSGSVAHDQFGNELILSMHRFLRLAAHPQQLFGGGPPTEKVHHAPLDEQNAKIYPVQAMDEGRKRVIGIMAAILSSHRMQTADDLFGGPQGSPRSDKLIAASIQWAEKIMQKIDERFSKTGKPSVENVIQGAIRHRDGRSENDSA